MYISSLIRLAILALIGVALPSLGQAQSYTESILYSFCSASGCYDGIGPYAGLIQASDGNFYGTTIEGGVADPDHQVEGFGTIYKISPAGVFTGAYDFCNSAGYACLTGEDPYAPLTEGNDGNFYGSANILIEMTPSGSVSTLGEGCSSSPYLCMFPSGLIQGSDGAFYGSVGEGGSYTESGAIIKVIPPNQDITVYAFCADGDCSDGVLPLGILVQGSDGDFYGVTGGGGVSNCDGGGCGTIFKITPSGTLTTLYTFCTQGYYPNCADGYSPNGGLIEGSDGDFYGVAEGGGAGEAGTVFKVSPAGVFTTLHSFCVDQTDGCPDGYNPTAALTLGSDGKFYGTTDGATAELIYCSGSGCGTAFSMTSDGTFTTLQTFSWSQGSAPIGRILQASDGNFYGTLYQGGVHLASGAIYKLTVSPPLPAPIQVAVSDSQIEANTPVQLSWKVLNAFSTTAQLCNAFVDGDAGDAGTWTGKQSGTYNSATGIYSGSATITPTANGIYTYSLTCGGSHSGFASVRVGTSKAATSTLLQSTSPVALASSITFTATVVTQPYYFPLSAKVKFSYGDVILGYATPINGVATLNLPVPNIPPGTYAVVASYPGDENYQASTNAANVVVLGYVTTAALAATPTMIAQGQSATVTDTITRVGASGYPTGSVAFYSGQSVVAHANLINGVATIMLPGAAILAPGTYPIEAAYNGDTLDQGAYNGQIEVTVLAATKTALTVSPTTVPANQTATLTAKVTEAYRSATPTGKVSFRVNGGTIATVNLDHTGTAVLSASDSGIPPGTYRVTAYYLGNSTTAASVSSTVDVAVQ